jgi:cob(I)alamin adenosyltransferase
MELIGRLQVYTGNGKGKTTAALGLAVRAVCAGLRVYVGQFMKDGSSAESSLPGRFPGMLEMEHYGAPGLIGQGEEPTAEDIRRAVGGLCRLEEVMTSGEFELVICDEMCTAMHLGLLDDADVYPFVEKRPAGVELVLTGRYASERLMEMADLVTEMKQVKHYFDTEGLEARRGIEF